MFLWGIVKSTVLWAFLTVLLGAVLFGAFSADGAIALGVIYLFLLLVNVVILAMRNIGRARIRRSNPFGATVGAIPWDFTNPFRGLTALRGVRKYNDAEGARRALIWAGQWFHLLWAVILLLVVGSTVAAWVI